MKILVLADPQAEAEFSQKFPKRPYIYIKSYAELSTWLDQADVVFDYLLAAHPEHIEFYQNQERENLLVLCQAAKVQLASFEQRFGKLRFQLAGFNGLPSFLNRPVLETTVLNPETEGLLQALCTHLDTDFTIVEDRVGMVTPRVVCMIINEACYTLQEGTASIQDIDLGMKLGTNYPFGPFEWADKIGVRHVYELLQAMYEDTKDERYKICPLLKTHYLKNEPFLPQQA